MPLVNRCPLLVATALLTSLAWADCLAFTEAKNHVGEVKSVVDVRQLQGRLVEIHGQVKEYDGRAEIILEEYRQLGGAGARIPPLPKNYDVEKKGRYSAGTFSHPKAKRRTPRKQSPNVMTQAPEDPEQ